MKLRHVASYGLVFAVLALVGCDQGRQTPAKVTVRVANVAPGFAELQFRRERITEATLGFKGSNEVSWDADTYDLYVDERSLNGAATRSWTVARQFQADRSYIIVLTEVGGEASPVILEHSVAGAADAQIIALHAGPNLPAMDLYLERPGVGIAGATPRGTLAVQGQLAPRNVPSGDYELWLTAAGNPANVLLASTTITLAAAATSTFIVTPESGEGTAALSVLLLQAGPTLLYDRNATAELRVINGAADTVPRDFAINRAFSPPLFSAVPFATPTPFVTIPVASNQPINVTPVGNPGVLELDQLFTIDASQRATLLFTGAAGTLVHVVVGEDGRRIHNEAKLQFFNAASQFSGALEFVLVLPGVDPANVAAFATLFTPGVSGLSPLPPGDYELYVRLIGTTTNVAGPIPISVAAEGIYGAIAVNGADTATANIVLLDDFP